MLPHKHIEMTKDHEARLAALEKILAGHVADATPELTLVEEPAEHGASSPRAWDNIVDNNYGSSVANIRKPIVGVKPPEYRG